MSKILLEYFILLSPDQTKSLNLGNEKDAKRAADGSQYPIETYHGLQEATAERIKRFEDETKAMLMRNSRSDLTPSTSEIGRTTSGKRNSLGIVQ